MNAKRIARLLVACIALMIGLVGCGGSTDPAGSAAPGSSQGLDASATPAQRAAALYQEAVSHPQSYFGLPEHPEGAGGSDVPTFDYALVAVKPGELPALLLRAMDSDGRWADAAEIVPLTVNDAGDGLSAGVALLWEDISQAEERQRSVMASAYGDGLLVEDMNRSTGEGVVWRRRFEADVMRPEPVCELRGGSDSMAAKVAAEEFVPIPWEPCPLSGANLDDRASLKALADGTWQSTAVREGKDRSAAAEQFGLITLTGTVRELDDRGIAALQGIENPNPPSDDLVMHAVLELDEPATLTALSAGGSAPREGEVRLILIERDTSELTWGSYQDKHVTAAIDPAMLMWSSDTSLPLGEPSVATAGIVVVDVG